MHPQHSASSENSKEPRAAEVDSRRGQEEGGAGRGGKVLTGLWAGMVLAWSGRSRELL